MPGQSDLILRSGRCSSAPPLLKSQPDESGSRSALDIRQSELEFRRDRWSHLRSRERLLHIHKGIIRLLRRPWQMDYALLRAYSAPNPNSPALRLQIQSLWLNRIPPSLREPEWRILERERVFAVRLSSFLDDCRRFDFFDRVRLSPRRPRRSLHPQRARRLQRSRSPRRSPSAPPSGRKRKAPEQLGSPGVKKARRHASFGAEAPRPKSCDGIGDLDVLPRELVDRIVGNVSLHDLPYLRLVNPAMKTVVDGLIPLQKVTQELNAYVLSGLVWWTRWAEAEHFDPGHIWSTPSQLLNRKEHWEALKLVSRAVALVDTQEPDYDRSWPDLVHAWWNVVTYAALARIHCEKWDCEALMMDVLDSEHSYLLETWEIDGEWLPSVD